MALIPAVFLDKDGTLLVDVPFNVDATRMVLAERAAEALTTLGQLGVPLVVVSNQAGVAHGHFEEEALGGVRQRLAELFNDCGAHLANFYYCPHHPQGVNTYAIECNCRKPQSGMLRRAAADLGIALDSSWMVGDILDDIEAGRRAGCKAILIDNGNETEWCGGPLRTPHHRVANLGDAADLIVSSFAAGRHSLKSRAAVLRDPSHQQIEVNHVAME
ncbi:MAG: HAD-SF-IA-v1: hydrolase, variant 1 family protein [Rhodocyclales bacterium]|nr:HAD-SF-IA-v1: hydrolase, variant 1 family protein [Rhodocyclales bacterium]